MKTVRKALDILEVFLNDEDELGIGTVARLTKLNISTAHRLASIMLKKGYLSQPVNRGKYSLGLKLLEFTGAIKKKIEVRDVALPFMEKLNKKINESVNLAILDANEAVYIEQIETTHYLRTYIEVGHRVPLHASGAGKILLASMTEEEVKQFHKDKGLPSYTENTIRNFSKLKKELSKIRREGVAIDNEERELGVRCVAAPVRDGNGNVVAAISVSGPTARLNDKRLGEVESLLKDCALKSSQAMGYKGE